MREKTIALSRQLCQDLLVNPMQLNSRFLSVLRSAAFVVGLFLASALPTFAQGAIPTGSPGGPDKLEPIVEEMRIKRLISHAQKEHQQNVQRAEQLSCLGAEIGTTFKQKHELGRDDLKKLDKLEKLTKSIRGAAGGSDDASKTEDMPTDLPAVISKMTELADALREEVKKTPRQVISATVIDRANVLLELIRRARDLSART